MLITFAAIRASLPLLQRKGRGLLGALDPRNSIVPSEDLLGLVAPRSIHDLRR